MEGEKNIVALIKVYQSLNLSDVLHHDKFLYYTLTFHSTAIEGSTLTEMETRLLLDEGITPGGKPLEHSQMVKDHYDALRFTLKKQERKQRYLQHWCSKSIHM